MSSETKVGARSLGETLRLVGSSEAFTKRVVIWTLPFGMLVAVAFDGGRFGTSRIGWALVGIAAHLFATIVMLALRLMFLPSAPYSPRPTTTLLIFLVGSISRSLAVGQLSVMFDLATDKQLIYRISAGALLGTLTLSVAAILAAVIKDYAQTQDELASEREALFTAQNSVEELIRQQHQEISEIVHASIEPALAEISENLSSISTKDSGNLRDSATKISNLIDSTLRPLSASLHQEREMQVPRAKASAKKPSLTSPPKKLILRNVVSPFAIYMVIVVPNTTGAFPYVGYGTLPAVLLAYVPLLLSLTLFVRLPISNIPIRSDFAFLLLSVVLALSWTPAIFILRRLNIDLIERFSLIPVATLVTLLVGLLLTYGFMVDSQRIEYASQLREANQELNLELNRTSQLIWHVRQRAAQTLHGSVQASLTAANMRILGAENVDEDLLEKVREDLVKATKALTDLERQVIDIKRSFADLIELWQGVCEVKLSINDELLDYISSNQVTSHCVNEIVKESVTNAIRHGKARLVEISIQDLNDGSIQIEVTNNGETNMFGTAGVGSQILDQITMDWTRQIVEDRVRVLARVALA
jgi:signal transduction histidine kinase